MLEEVKDKLTFHIISPTCTLWGIFSPLLYYFLIYLKQGFPTYGTRTTGGTQTGPRWYAEIFKAKHLNKKNIISSSAMQK
jgi:hypothetical protein